jgi:hypothetical protein
MFEKPNQEEIYLQNTREPLVEIFQHKGSSECSIDPMILYAVLSNYPTKTLNQNLGTIFLPPQNLALFETH